MTLDDEPRFAIAALRDAYGLDCVPLPMKIEGGGVRAVDGTEVAILGGVLRLLAVVTPQHRQASLAVSTGDQEISIIVKVPPATS
ncbi:MAG TPA: hypothetical protein VGD80_13645 [Kofleriaceae bacterium]